MNFLYELRDEELLNLVLNPASECKAEAIGLLKERHSALVKHPAITSPKPEFVPARDTVSIPPVKPAADPRETIEVMKKFPFTQLLDVVLADSIYSKEIRLGAARILLNRWSGVGEYAVKIMNKEAENKEFRGLMAEARKTPND